jgi:hypothetical protein
MPDSMDKAPKTQSSLQGDIHIEHRPEALLAKPLAHEGVQRALHTPSALLAADVLALQHTVGNAAVQHILADRGAPQHPHPAPPLVVQAKLNVGPADDKYEREADRVAEQVINSAPTVAASPRVAYNAVKRKRGCKGSQRLSSSRSASSARTARRKNERRRQRQPWAWRGV